MPILFCVLNDTDSKTQSSILHLPFQRKSSMSRYQLGASVCTWAGLLTLRISAVPWPHSPGFPSSLQCYCNVSENPHLLNWSWRNSKLILHSSINKFYQPYIISIFFFSFRQYLINFWVTLRLFLQSTYLCPKCLQFTFSNTVNLSVHSDNASPALAQQSLSSFKSSLLLNFSELMSAYFPFRASALLAFAICFSPNAYQITLIIFSP